MRRRSGTRALAAVLFTDIVDSSAVASRLGDARWKELIARHHAIVRRELKRFGGKELDTAGDGFYASFGEPASAIRCASAAAEAVRQLGIEIRTGVHFGECEQVGGKLGGIAVVVGARVMSLGGAGDVLVTASTSDLVAGAGFGFQDRGAHSLKGVDGRWHVLAVSEVDGVPRPPLAEPQVAEQRLGEVQPSAPGSRRWQVVAAAAVFALLAAAVAVPLARRAGGNSEIDPNSIGILDPESGDVIATLGLEERPGSVAATADAVWVTNPDAGTVTRIEPTQREVRDTIQVGEDPTGIVVGFDAVWVLESGGPSVSRISPDTNAVVGEAIPVGNGPAGIAAGEGAVWVTNRFDGTISRIDPDTNAVVETIPVGLDPRGIAVGFGSVWVGLAGSTTVVRIDPATNRVTKPISVGNSPGSLAVSADAVWVANTADDTVTQISPDTDSVEDTIPVGDAPSGIAVVDQVVWVANEGDGTLSRIEPGQPSARGTVIGSTPQGLAGVEGDLWVSVRGTATSHQGGTLRLVSRKSLPTLDSTVAYEPASALLLPLLGDGLVAFKSVGGTDGATLVPDLATSNPTPTDGGRTYTFTLRSGVRYSSGEVVAPVDFLLALERGFRLNPEDHHDLYGGLVGGKACAQKPRTCDLSRGIVTDQAAGTVTFHLLDADPDFLYKLTLPFAYPVPPSVPDDEQVSAGIPGTGPYMLETAMTHKGLALVRNPYFREWSPAAQPSGYVDRIDWRFGVKPQAQFDAVAAGDADLAFDSAASGSIEEMLVRFAAQVHTSPSAATLFIVLDTETPPFDDVDVRKAVNLALDRDRVAQISGGERINLPTCQQLPPNFPGYESYCPYTVDPGPDGLWTAQDLEKAKRLVDRSGTKGMRVTFEYTPYFFSSRGGRLLGDYMIELLRQLGYRAAVKSLPVEDLYDPGNEFQMALGAWIADYPAASNFIANQFTCDASVVPSAGFCDPAIDEMIERAIRVQAHDPAASGALWAKIDHAIVDQAPYLWLVNTVTVDFVSERVGNYQWSLQRQSVFLNQLWVE